MEVTPHEPCLCARCLVGRARRIEQEGARVERLGCPVESHGGPRRRVEFRKRVSLEGYETRRARLECAERLYQVAEEVPRRRRLRRSGEAAKEHPLDLVEWCVQLLQEGGVIG